MLQMTLLSTLMHIYMRNTIFIHDTNIICTSNIVNTVHYDTWKIHKNVVKVSLV